MAIPTTARGRVTIPFDPSHLVHGSDAEGNSYPITALTVDPKDAGTIGKTIADAPRTIGYWDITPHLKTMRSHLQTAAITAAGTLALMPTALKWTKEKAGSHPIQWSLWNSNKTELAKTIFGRGCIEISQHPYRTALACLGIAAIGHTPTIISRIFNASKKIYDFTKAKPIPAASIAIILTIGGTTCYFKKEELVQKFLTEKVATSLAPVIQSTAQSVAPPPPTIFSIAKKVLKLFAPDISSLESWLPKPNPECHINWFP